MPLSVTILAAESLGVRSLATLVRGLPHGPLLIDPGAALGPRRQGLPPHAQEEAALTAAAARLQDAARGVRRIAITHFHHDHFAPFTEQRWIASGCELAASLYAHREVYLRDLQGPLNPRQRARAKQLTQKLLRCEATLRIADGCRYGDLSFSPPFRHGDDQSPGGWLVMVAAGTDHARLVHMADTQLLNAAAVEWALGQQPTVLITAGPPLYLPQLGAERAAIARRNLLRLVTHVPHVIVDHHLLRGGEVSAFLAEAAAEAQRRAHRLQTAAESLAQEGNPLESRRRALWGISGR